MTFYTIEEVRKNNTVESCWIIANKNVYDVTTFLSRHPGGKFCILSKAGTDCTKYFDWHSVSGKESWESYKIGEIKCAANCVCC
jgi:cytochrome b involved in lipid metabolism